MAPSRHSVTRQGEVLPDRAEACEEGLSADWIATSTHRAFTTTRRLMTVLCTIVDPRGRLHEHVLHAG
jgi:hypothetical protein